MVVDQHFPALREPRKGEDRYGIAAGDDARRFNQTIAVQRAGETDFPAAGESDGRADGGGRFGVNPGRGGGEGGRHPS